MAQLVWVSQKMLLSPWLPSSTSRDQDKVWRSQTPSKVATLLESLPYSPAGVGFRRSTKSRRQRSPGQEMFQGQQVVGAAVCHIDFCSPGSVPGPVGFKRPLPCTLHLLTPFKPNLLAHFARHPTLSQGMAQHGRMGGEQMACSIPSQLFSLQTLSKENP